MALDVYSNKEFMDHLKTRSEFPYIDEGGTLYYRKNATMPPGFPSMNGSATVEGELQDLDDVRLGIMDEVCAEISRAPRAHVPNLLRANVSLRQVASMKRCSRWSLKKYFCVNV